MGKDGLGAMDCCLSSSGSGKVLLEMICAADTIRVIRVSYSVLVLDIQERLGVQLAGAPWNGSRFDRGPGVITHVCLDRIEAPIEARHELSILLPCIRLTRKQMGCKRSRHDIACTMFPRRPLAQQTNRLSWRFQRIPHKLYRGHIENPLL